MTISFSLPLRLPLLNTMLRTNHWKRARQTKALAWQVRSRFPCNASAPMQRVAITVTRHSPKMADHDGLVASVKPLLDVLQPTSKRHPYGLGIIANDSPDCVILRAEQVKSKLTQTDVVIEPLDEAAALIGAQ